MLAVAGITVTFAGVAAVDDVSLTVPDGCVLALLGPSGCGKSTLLRAIAGLEPVRSGTISWDGVDLARIPVHRRGFGLMFQDGVLFPHRTVAGNVGYGLRVVGLRGTAADQRVRQLLDLVGLRGFGDRSVTELSGGEAQRVALARALAPRPRLLLLDEPLAALDRALRDSLLTDLRAILGETGTPAIFVTHDQQEAFAIADRVAVMRAGRIVQTGRPQQVWAAPADEWVARFVGYPAVIDGVIAIPTDGTPIASTVLGDVPVVGSSEGGSGPSAEPIEPGTRVRVAVRPAALVVDPDGELIARSIGTVPGPDRTLLTVRVTETAAPGGLPVDRQPVCPLPAVAFGADQEISEGSAVRLRFDPSATAVIHED